MKRTRLIIFLVATLVILVFALPASAQDGFETQGSTLVSYTGNDASVTVPNGITHIGYSAFAGKTQVASIALPNTISHIGASAFADCTALSSINLPKSMVSIQNAAFKNCTSLSSIVIPRGITGLSAEAFYGCTALSAITVPDSVTTVGASCFYGVEGLTITCIQSSFIHGYADFIGADTAFFAYTQKAILLWTAKRWWRIRAATKLLRYPAKLRP